MGVTTHVKDTDVRERLFNQYPTPSVDFDGAPTMPLTSNHAIVGTAYDLLVQGQLGVPGLPPVPPAGGRPYRVYAAYLKLAHEHRQEPWVLNTLDVEDLHNLHSKQPADFPAPGAECQFKVESQETGAGYLDLLYPDCIVDVKTSQAPIIEHGQWHQVLVYARLAIRQGRPIKDVGFYFARYGEIFTVSVPEGLVDT